MNKHWKSKYFETNIKESHVNIFRSLEIENYLKQLLKKKEFNLHTHRLNFSNSVLQIFISAYKKNAPYKKNNKFKPKKTKLLNKVTSKNILKTINNFTNNKRHVVLKVLNLNRHNQQNGTKTSLNLDRFRIPEIKQLYPLISNQQNTANLLGLFISEYLKTTKRHNFFFSSLNKSLSLLLKQKNSKIKGIKILIKGRLNNAARSRNKCVKIGSIPLITKSRNIDYSESTAFTPNGTIGIKIWISHKKPLDTRKSLNSEANDLTTHLKNF